MPPKRMTANPVRPARYRPGKPLTNERSSSSEPEAASDEDEATQIDKKPSRPPPKATSFPTDAAKRITANLKNVDLEARRARAEAEERARVQKEKEQREREEREAGFVTEEEDDEDEDVSDSNDVSFGDVLRQGIPQKQSKAPSSISGSEESDSDEDTSSSSSSASPAPKLLRPVFLSKSQRLATPSARPPSPTPAERAAAEATRRAAAADALIQAKLEEDAALRAAGRRDWDDDDVGTLPDDTDGLDPELERAQWVARELGRVKRARAALEAAEAERAEIERRRGMTAAEREREDEAYVAAQREEKAGRDKAGFMQRYHHRGAFFMDEEGGEAKGDGGEELARRNLMGAQYASAEGMRETLPEYLQVRDVTRIGRKGRTRYKDMRSEDTGRFGDFGKGYGRGLGYERRNRSGPRVDDERFKPDGPQGAEGATGANAGRLGERRDGGERDKKRLFDEERDRGEVKRVKAGD